MAGAPSSSGTSDSEVRPSRGEILAALARVLDYNPAGDISHHARVAVSATRVASRLAETTPRLVFYAGLVHDIGMLSAGQDPPHSWSLEEQANQPLLRCHPLVGAQLIAAVPELFGVAQMILDHHEWTNGHGYPRGRSEEEIPVGAQVLRFADTSDMVLREQTAPELVPFLDAVRNRTGPQVGAAVVHAGMEALGDPEFYAQLLSAADVQLLVQTTIRHTAANDLAATEEEVTRLLELFGHVSDARSSDRIGHSRRVANLAVLVAMALSLPEPQMTQIKWAALVHDVGLVAVPRTLLNRPGPLTDEELAQVRRNTTVAELLIGPVCGLEEAVYVAASYGEAFDGSGYPRGLSGREIPVGARILAVCDTFDALTSRRPYREARDTSLAVDILVKGSGSVFDPDIVEAAVPVFLIAQRAREPAGADTGR